MTTTPGTGAEVGTIYLLHFDLAFKHAKHYTGWARALAARLAHHRNGDGARLLAVIREHGIDWQLARTWQGTRADERALKNQGGASRRCPLCGITATATTVTRRQPKNPAGNSDPESHAEGS